MPSAALQLVVATIDEVTRARGSAKLSFGILFALWAASSGVNALAEGLNAAYDVRETRAWWKVRLISIAITIVLAVLIISALTIVLYGGHVGESVANSIVTRESYSKLCGSYCSGLLPSASFCSPWLLSTVLCRTWAPSAKERACPILTTGNVGFHRVCSLLLCCG
jgi:uncharacterized BrkB/YihY/UPF0761 family membrane protein